MKKLNFAQQALIHSLKDYAYGEHGETYPDIQAHPFESLKVCFFILKYHTTFWSQFDHTQKQNIVLGCKKSIV